MQVHLLFPQNILADSPKKYSIIEDILEVYTQNKVNFSCAQTHSLSTRVIASVLKNDLTDPHPIKPSLEGQKHSSEYSCSQRMKPLQRLLILPPSLSFETNHDLIDQKKIWKILHSHFGKSRQLKIVSWDRMHSLLKATSENQDKATILKKQNEGNLQLAHLTDADAYLITLIDEQKTQIQVYSTQDTHLLWEEETPHTSDYSSILSILDQNMDAMVKNFLKSFPYHGIQILDPLWKEVILEKNFQNLAKIDVGSNSSIQKGDPIFWIEICRINKAPLFKEGRKAHILAKGEVLKKERGILLAHITHYRSGLSDWKEKLSEGTLIVFANNNKSTPLITDQDTALHPIKNKADKTRSRLTTATGILSILILLAVLL